MAEHRDTVISVAFSENGRYLATSSSDNTARIWDAHTGEVLVPSIEHQMKLGAVALSPDGTWLAIAHEKSVTIWDVAQRQERSVLSHDGPIGALAFSPDGKSLACGISTYTTLTPRTLRVWDWATGEAKLNMQKVATQGIDHLAYSPDGRSLAVGDRDGSLELWDLVTGQKQYELQGHPGGVLGLAFSPDGATLASGGRHSIRFWDVATGGELIAIPRASVKGSCFRFTPDGLTLISGEVAPGNCGQVALWSGDCTDIPMSRP